MENENIDHLFSEKLKNNDKIPLSVNWNKEKGWQMFEKLLPKKLENNLIWMKVAVGVVIIIGSFLVGFLIQKHFSANTTLASEADKAIKEISLPGGHHCSLAPYSKILYTHSSSATCADTLYLDGVAFVKTSSQKTLVIKAKNSIVSCFDAEVNIRANITETTTVISTIRGKVLAQCTNNHFPALTVAPSEQYSIFDRGIMAFKAQNNDPNFMAWKTGVLEFNNAPLEYAVKVMEDYYGVCISIEKDEMKYCRITSQFKNLSLKDALQNIQSNLEVKITQKGLMYLIRGKGC